MIQFKERDRSLKFCYSTRGVSGLSTTLGKLFNRRRETTKHNTTKKLAGKKQKSKLSTKKETIQQSKKRIKLNTTGLNCLTGRKREPNFTSEDQVIQ